MQKVVVSVIVVAGLLAACGESEEQKQKVVRDQLIREAEARAAAAESELRLHTRCRMLGADGWYVGRLNNLIAVNRAFADTMRYNYKDKAAVEAARHQISDAMVGYTAAKATCG